MAFKSYYKLVKYSKPLPFYVQDVSGSANTVRINSTDSDIISSIETSTDNSTWTHPTAGVDIIDIPVPANGRVYVRCSADTWYTDDSTKASFGSATGNFKVGGNIMSLIYGSNYTGSETSFPSGSTNNFKELFNNNTYLTDASDLELPATTLTEGCYDSMFYRCTSLTTPPALPATTMANACYQHMFQGCTSLTTAPELPATNLADFCYNSIFLGCTSLTQAPVLPATTLAQYCYNGMFYECTALTSAPVLPATTLQGFCYTFMFYSCTSLTQAPALPATNLAEFCYQYMFNGCTALTTAPVLPATTLANYCYGSMFDGCTSLNNVTCLAEDITASSCTGGWLNNVASTGTFTKSANMSGWSTGADGIPSGWTIQDAQ